jgi:hypothetical protein
VLTECLLGSIAYIKVICHVLISVAEVTSGCNLAHKCIDTFIILVPVKGIKLLWLRPLCESVVIAWRSRWQSSCIIRVSADDIASLANTCRAQGVPRRAMLHHSTLRTLLVYTPTFLPHGSEQTEVRI